MNDAIPMLGQSAPMLALAERVSLVAGADRPTLVLGERGSGKELIARRLHLLSARWEGPWVAVNLGALPAALLESELFGHEAGAFTGAQRRRRGRFELASGGSLFLDEIHNASLAVQERLLRALETRTIDRLGGEGAIAADARVIAAANVDLRAEVEAGRFRADLLDRLAFEVVWAPPLRERGEDIELLAAHFAREMAAELDRPRFAGLSVAAIETLRRHAWPGNVRELKSAIERSVLRMEDPSAPLDAIALDPFEGCFAQRTRATPPTGERRSLAEELESLERGRIEAALEAASGHQGRAARILGISYDALRGRMKRLGLAMRSRRPSAAPRRGPS